MRMRVRIAKGLLIALVFALIPISNYSINAAGPQTPSCGNYKVTTNKIIVGVKFPKGTYQINAFGISCTKVMGSKGLFAQFLKLKDKDPLPTPWIYLADAIGAPKFSSGPGVGFRVQLITPTPTPTPTVTPYLPPPTPTVSKQKTSLITYIDPSVSSENVELCKIQQLNNDNLGGPRTGFPTSVPLYAGTGTVKWALVPLDFVDLPGEKEFNSRIDDQMALATEWANITSEGKLKIEWQVQKEWIRMPGVSKDYVIPVASSNDFRQPEQVAFWQKAIVAADKIVDFTGIQGIHFILPKGQTIAVNGIKAGSWYPAVKDYITNEGTSIDFFSIPGEFQDQVSQGRTYWSYWLYHYLSGLGNPKYGGSKIATPFHTFLIQGSTEGERELGGWNRFLLGWMSENRVYCRQASNITSLDITLVPLVDNKNQGIKLAVIPLSGSRALILESRRVTKFACTTYTERNGVLAYVYDAKYGATEEYFAAISPPGRAIESYSCASSPSSDPLLHRGDKVTFEGITIELLLHGDFDRVRITRP